MAPTLTPVVTQFDPQAPSSSRPQREPKKKALLIGINGLSSPTIGYDVLRGSHRDVAEMKRLLIGAYGYPDEDIQVLVDDGIPGHVQPERQNIVSRSRGSPLCVADGLSRDDGHRKSCE